MAPSLKFQTLNLWLTSQSTCPLLPTLPPFDLHTCCSFSWVASTPSPSLLSSLLGRCRKSVPRPDLPNTLSGLSRCFENYDIVGGNSLPCPWSQLEVSWELCFVSQLLSHVCFCVTLLAILVCCRSFDYFFVLFCLCGFFLSSWEKGPSTEEGLYHVGLSIEYFLQWLMWGKPAHCEGCQSWADSFGLNTKANWVDHGEPPVCSVPPWCLLSLLNTGPSDFSTHTPCPNYKLCEDRFHYADLLLNSLLVCNKKA